ncbi:hypothetical protein HKX48_007596 [Thoreauomyces humboldtii]|nr:hypothetical protein HKX48_007596 [Thoreauomyces humboldtii]
MTSFLRITHHDDPWWTETIEPSDTVYSLTGPMVAMLLCGNRVSHPALWCLLLFSARVLEQNVAPMSTERSQEVAKSILFQSVLLYLAFYIRRLRQDRLQLSRRYRDMTERADVARLQEEKAEKARTQFISWVFHEIRVPLNSLVLGATLLESDDSLRVKLEPAEIEIISRFRAALGSIEGIINDRLDYNKMTEGKLSIRMVPMVLHTTLSNVVWGMEALDEARIRQIVANFLSNAAKFTAPYYCDSTRLLLHILEHKSTLPCLTAPTWQ